MYEKLSKYPKFYDICPKKINKIPEFYIIIARKIFFPEFWGARAPCPRLLRLRLVFLVPYPTPVPAEIPFGIDP